MGNYNNIKPYSDFSHTAAGRGGVEKFLSELQSASYNNGRMDERGVLIWEIPLVGGAAIGLWELGKCCVRKIKRARNVKKLQIEQQIHHAEAAARECLETVEEPDKNTSKNETTEE